MIAATAVAAIVQLRHMRGGNQINALTEVRETLESPGFYAARRFIQDTLPTMLDQPGFAARIERSIPDDELQAIFLVSNFYEHLGAFVKYGIIDKQIACDLWNGVLRRDWAALLPVTTIRRRWLKGRAFSENFEYLVVLSEDFLKRHPDGTYPQGMRRMPEAATAETKPSG